MIRKEPNADRAHTRTDIVDVQPTLPVVPLFVSARVRAQVGITCYYIFEYYCRSRCLGECIIIFVIVAGREYCVRARVHRTHARAMFGFFSFCNLFFGTIRMVAWPPLLLLPLPRFLHQRSLSLSTSTVTAHATKCSYMVFVVRFSLLYSINELYAPKTLCLVLFFFSFVIWPFCAEVCVCCRRQKFMYSFGCSLRRSYIIVHLICADVCVRVNARAAQCIVQNCLTKIRCNNKALLFFSSPNAECMACRNMQFGSAFLLLPQKMVIKLWCCSRRASISCFHYFVGPSPSRSHTLGLICCLAYGAARIRLMNSGAQCYWSEQLLTWNHYAQN